MAIEIKMPALSDTMESGSLVSWLVEEGDTISSGDVIAEIETDKAVMELESIGDGVVGSILVAAGTEDIGVGTSIAILLKNGEDPGYIEADTTTASTPAGGPVMVEATVVAAAPQIAGTHSSAARQQADREGRVKASPLARRFAGQMGVSLASISGSGPNGRIIKRDLKSTGPGPVPDSKPPADVPFEEIKLTNMRKVIARRLSESKRNVPHFYLTIDVELDNLLRQKKGLRVRVANQYFNISINDFVIRAAALALKEVPAANVQYAGDSLFQFERADISIAVAIDGGLMTPIIRSADSKSIAKIAAEMKELATRAKEGKLKPEDYQGGTFSISNLGMYGIREFSAVINPPQGAILAVGAGCQRAIARDGCIESATMMTCTLSCDHRVIDGAVAAEFLGEFKSLIEGPLKKFW